MSSSKLVQIRVFLFKRVRRTYKYVQTYLCNYPESRTCYLKVLVRCLFSTTIMFNLALEQKSGRKFYDVDYMYGVYFFLNSHTVMISFVHPGLFIVSYWWLSHYFSMFPYTFLHRDKCFFRNLTSGKSCVEKRFLQMEYTIRYKQTNTNKRIWNIGWTHI